MKRALQSYGIVVADNPEQLAKKVLEALKENPHMKPQGGVATNVTYNSPQYYQALYGEVNEPS